MVNKRQLESPESAQAEKIRKMPDEVQLKDLMVLVMETNNTVKNIEKNLATLLERTEKNECEIIALKNIVADLDARLNEREQADLIDHFRITGLPPISPSREDQRNLVLNILRHVKVNCTAKDLTYVNIHRNANKTGATIVGKFASHAMRVEAFNAFRDVSKISPITYGTFIQCTANDVDGIRQLRLRSYLTKATLALANQTREHRGAKFEFVWENEGRVLARKTANSPVIHIRSLHQLAKIVAETA